jgi:hypothetical protein
MFDEAMTIRPAERQHAAPRVLRDRFRLGYARVGKDCMKGLDRARTLSLARSLSLATLTLSTLALAATAPSATALRRARPWRLELLRALPSAFPADGALLVAPQPADRPGNSDPAAVRLTSEGGAPIRLRVEELAPSLYRLVPTRRLARGRYTIRGIGATSLSMRVSGSVGGVCPTPELDSIVRARRTAPGTTVVIERITVTLRALPPDAVVVFARWPDWHDAEGGRYGAWAPLAGAATSFPLICTAEDRCGPGIGHIPRPRERGELLFADAAGRVSAPSPSFVVE